MRTGLGPAGGAVLDLFARAPFLSSLDADRRYRLWQRCRWNRWDAGAVIRGEGDPADGLLLLLDGAVALIRYTRAGDELRLASLQAPCAVDKAAVLRARDHSVTVVAGSDCVVAVLPRDALLDLLDREPEVRRHVLAHLAGEVHAHRERLAVAALGGGVERVAAWLLTGLQQGGAGDVALPGSQDGLARELGLSRVTVNRALKQLERAGVLRVRRGVVVVEAVQELRALAG